LAIAFAGGKNESVLNAVTNFFIKRLQAFGARQRDLGMERCNAWAGRLVAALEPESLLDVGCGDGSLLMRYLGKLPRDYCGVEAAPDLCAKAEQRGIKVYSYDLNGRWPFEFGEVRCRICISGH